MMTHGELRQAYKRWQLRFSGLEMDQDLYPFLLANKRNDWLKGVREALQLSMDSVAKKMNVSKSTYANFEKSEANMSIKLATLARVAKAMDCEVVYAIRPILRQNFSQVVWKQLEKEARLHPRVQRTPREKKPWALSGTASDLLNDTQFRLEKGWSQRKPNRRSRER